LSLGKTETGNINIKHTVLALFHQLF